MDVAVFVAPIVVVLKTIEVLIRFDILLFDLRIDFKFIPLDNEDLRVGPGKGADDFGLDGKLLGLDKVGGVWDGSFICKASGAVEVVIFFVLVVLRANDVFLVSVCASGAFGAGSVGLGLLTLDTIALFFGCVNCFVSVFFLSALPFFICLNRSARDIERPVLPLITVFAVFDIFVVENEELSRTFNCNAAARFASESSSLFFSNELVLAVAIDFAFALVVFFVGNKVPPLLAPSDLEPPVLALTADLIVDRYNMILF